MKKYRKRPVVIEAEQWFPGRAVDGVCLGLRDNPLPITRGPHVHTLEGELAVIPGDWIIKGIVGEYYPCKPEIFEATYEPIV